MKHKKSVLQFLEDNHCMINSLMSPQEKRKFRGDVVTIIKNEIKRQIEEDDE